MTKTNSQKSVNREGLDKPITRDEADEDKKKQYGGRDPNACKH